MLASPVKGTANQNEEVQGKKEQGEKEKQWIYMDSLEVMSWTVNFSFTASQTWHNLCLH
jgi:hypothetical protein